MDSMENFSCFNLSNPGSLTQVVWSLEPVVLSDEPTRYIVTVVCFLFILFGIPWNLTVLLIIITKKIYSEEPAAVMLLNLALTDLFLCIYIIPFNLVPGITGEFKFGSSDKARCEVCQTGVIFVILLLVLLNNFAVMSVDRLIYIKWAIHYYRIMRPWKLIVFILVSWIVSTVVAIPPVFGFGELQFSTAVGFCTIKFSGNGKFTKNIYYLIVVLFFILVPLGILGVTNTWVIFIAQKHVRKLYADTKAQKKQFRKSFYQAIKKKHNNVQINFVKMYAAIFITFIVTWTPIVIRLLIGVGNEGLEFDAAVRVLASVAYIMLLSQVMVYPSLMAVLVPEVRRRLVEIVKRFQRGMSVRPTHNEIEHSKWSRQSSGASIIQNVSVVELGHVAIL